MPSLQNNIGFLNTLQSVTPQILAETVQQVWQAIVTEWFPGRHGYKWSFHNTMADATVIQVIALEQNPLTPNDWVERQIFLVECKPPSSDTPTGWDDTIIGQSRNHLSQALNPSGRWYAAVAIGLKVRFYQFDGTVPANQQLVQLHQGTFDMSESDGIVQVEDMMSYIKENGWQWAI
ncbi:hypothetical protein BO78DRAFT_401289 [Aspergillus sclerotiicarbonarius CBS 121057]|uniref:Uncharacterized protein n=1 Tax=Aspergillus sclerotiicarbonarius (strain CBS 121057 / IBT 28362) TaxID=1448318 RepID=A0A319DUN7_ASPSB|nr:hypothetical protein BO78DRAFT_401289 [Aspergillus sclerotiicarbonarius CBS 121057]